MAQVPVHYIAIFDTLHLTGLVALVSIVLTAWLSPSIHRSSTWFLFIWSWLMTSMANIIIIGQQTGAEPMTAICLFQAMLVYSLPVLNSFSAVAFTLQVYLSIKGAIEGRSGISRGQLIWIHALPLLACAGVGIEVVVLGLTTPEHIARDTTGMFCHLSTQFPSRLTAGITIVAMCIFMFTGFKVFRIIRRRQEALMEIAGPGMKAYVISPEVVTRVIVFSCCPIVALALSSLQYLSASHITDTTANLILALLPLLAACIFGSQKDILHTWISFIPRRQDSGNQEVKPATVP